MRCDAIQLQGKISLTVDRRGSKVRASSSIHNFSVVRFEALINADRHQLTVTVRLVT